MNVYEIGYHGDEHDALGELGDLPYEQEEHTEAPTTLPQTIPEDDANALGELGDLDY